jgi:rhodanese-related sulfurtransferase
MASSVDREQVRKLLRDEAQLVETLPVEEYRDQHLPGAIHLPLRHIEDPERRRALDPARPVIVYCWDSA